MSDETPRGWLWTCACGSMAVMRNAAPVVILSDEPCLNCQTADLAEECDGGRVASELGWCACGSPSEVDRWMHAYLTEAQPPWAYSLPEQTWALLAYIADGLGWTEHGGSVRFAWLADAGKEALANLTEALASPSVQEKP